MPIRRFLRGDSSINTEEVESFLKDHYSLDSAELSPLDSQNWLSVPFVLNDEFFVKVITPQNIRTHSFFTWMRNLGITVSGSHPFFEGFDSPSEMANHELESIEAIRELGINTPHPIEVIEHNHGEDQIAFLVYEYLEGFEPMSNTDFGDEILNDLFENLRRLHNNGFAHGDFSLENVLVVDDKTYFIDSTNVKQDGLKDAIAYDLACALGALAPVVGEEKAVEIASALYSEDELHHALDFLVVARLRPGLEKSFSVLKLRKAIL